MKDRGRAIVACPTYAGKSYCLDQWIGGYRALTYDNKCAYQVDNTKHGTQYFDVIKSKGIDCSHVVPWRDWDRTFKRCWELILRRAQQVGAYWVYSVEADNVPAPESLDIMINLAIYGNVNLVTHSYPMHASAAKASGIDPQSWYYNELGCMLISRSLLERAMTEFEAYGQIVIALWKTCDKYHGGYVKLTNKFKVEHLDGYQESFANLEASEIPGLMMPTPKMPEDYGTKLPKCLEKA